MKKNNANHKSNGALRERTVHIEFKDVSAKGVNIAGTFNDWRPEATPMMLVGEGRWVKELVLAPGIYEYRLVVDGHWMPDPRTSDTTPNPFGELNSVLKVNRPEN